MIRMQIQLTEGQQTALRAISRSTGRSMADLVREGLDHVVSARPRPNRKEQIERAIRLAGQFSSGSSDGSRNHDRHLAEAFR